MSLTTPLVSVIVPCYNAARWLPATLESAVSQTWPRVEIVVVDDGSSDDSVSIARSFESRGVRVESIPNSGAAAARNHGISLAHGDYFQFLDADDLLAPDKLEHQLARLLTAEPGTVATCSWARFVQTPSEAIFRDEVLWTDLPSPDWLVTSWKHHAMMATAAWLVPRQLVDKVGPWTTSFGPQNPVDDMEYFARVVLAAQRVFFFKEARVYYRSSLDGSLSQLRGESAWQAIYGSFHVTADRLLEAAPTTEAREAVATALQWLIYESYPLVPELRTMTEKRIQHLGGTHLRPDAGPRRRLLQALIGWKATKRIRDWMMRPESITGR